MSTTCDCPKYIQVGVTAMRAPDGSFLPAVPLYIRATPTAIAEEKKLTQDIGHLLALRMKHYQEEAAKAEAAILKKRRKKAQSPTT